MANLFEDFSSKFAEFAGDIATVEVMTFSGEVALKPPAGKKLLPSLDLEKMTADWGVEPTSKLKLAAVTRINPDFDTVNIRAPGFTEGEMAQLVKIHEAAVGRAIEGRTNFLELLGSLITA